MREKNGKTFRREISVLQIKNLHTVRNSAADMIGLPFLGSLLRRTFFLPYAFYVVAFVSSGFAFVCVFRFLFIKDYILLFLSLLCL